MEINYIYIYLYSKKSDNLTINIKIFKNLFFIYKKMLDIFSFQFLFFYKKSK